MLAVFAMALCSPFSACLSVHLSQADVLSKLESYTGTNIYPRTYEPVLIDAETLN